MDEWDYYADDWDQGYRSWEPDEWDEINAREADDYRHEMDEYREDQEDMEEHADDLSWAWRFLSNNLPTSAELESALSVVYDAVHKELMRIAGFGS